LEKFSFISSELIGLLLVYGDIGMPINWARVEAILLALSILAIILILLSHYFEAKQIAEEE